MPIRDDPLLHGAREILPEPCNHRAIGDATRRHRIQTHKMNLAVVEGVILLSSGSQAARLAVARQGKTLEIRNRQRRIGRLRSIMVADCRPTDRLPENVLINVEMPRGELSICAGFVNVVPQHQHHVRIAALGEGVVGVTHR